MLPAISQAIASDPRIVFTVPVKTEPSIRREVFSALLYGKITPTWVLVQPLPININQDDNGSFVVGDDIFLVYGDGNTRNEAIHDYVTSFLEFYQLVKDGAEANPFDNEQFLRLQSYLQSL